MAVSGAIGGLGLVLQAASQLREVGNTWYRVSNEWASFPEKIDRLRQRHDLWMAACTRVGMLSDDTLQAALRSAQSLLDSEQERLNKRLSHHCKCWPKTRSTIFPSMLGSSIQRITDSLDHILSTLQLGDDVAIALDKKVLRTVFSFPIKKDDRFVPLERTQHRICEALENPQGPIVVGLHGGAGKGKSTLARHIALHYKPRPGEDGVFEHVFLLDCGPQENTLVLKQLELLNQLGFVSNEPEEETRSDYAVSIQKRLAALLKNLKILIILDDVWHSEFVMGFVKLFGSEVKCLITSQIEDLCRDITDCLPIRIEDISQEDARKVLASHVGFPDNLIPADLQDIADKMIEETQANPLALASLASAIPPKRPTELKQWEATFRGLFELLDRENPRLTFGARYPRSFWATMRLSMKSLEDENTQNLLILRSMCRGTSISQDVIEFLYGSRNFGGDLNMFIHRRNALETMEWIQISGESEEMSPSWSMHFLRQKFIMKDRRDTVDSLLASFANKNPHSELDPHQIRTINDSEKETKVLAIVSIFYFEKSLAKEMHVTSHLPIPLDNFNDLKRNVIEPLVRLLVQPLSELDHHFVLQVFLEYVHNGIIDDDGASHLLALPTLACAILETLQRAALVAESPFLDENKHGIMEVLVNLLKDGDDRKMQQSTIEALAYIVVPGYHRSFILHYPGVLDKLIECMSKERDVIVQQHATRTIANLAAHADERKLKILNCVGALEGLIECMSKERDVIVQQKATRALANLAAGGEEMTFKILNCAEALQGLIECMSKERDAIVQQQATRALASLAAGADEMKLKILNCAGALEGLIECMSKERDAIVQQHATWTIANLAAGGEEMTFKILNCAEALQGLIECMSKERDAIVQQQATRALASLAAGADEMKLKILNCAGALEGLIECMSKERDAIVQQHATWTIANLAARADEMKFKILNCAEALQGLIECMSKERDVIVQQQANRALANLAAGGEEMKFKILNCAEALQGLIECMSKERDAIVQQQANRALANLAAGADEMKLKILNCTGALEGLIECMSKGRDVIVQQQATRTLANLAAGGEEMEFKILNCAEALQGLIECMSKERDAIVQQQANRALANLAAGADEMKFKILTCAGALEGLIDCMSKGRDVIVQQQATRTLANLAAGGEEMKFKILNCAEALQGLIECMSKERDAIVQQQANRALANLAAGADEMKLKILNCAEALQGLIECMSKERDVIVQQHATQTLANLVAGGEEMKLKILNCAGAVEGLIECMSKETDAIVQQHANHALANLAAGGEEIKLKILNYVGALEGLIECMSKERDVIVQQHAT